MDPLTAAYVTLAIFVGGVIFQSGRLSARVDQNTKDIDALTHTARELARDVGRLVRRRDDDDDDRSHERRSA